MSPHGAVASLLAGAVSGLAHIVAVALSPVFVLVQCAYGVVSLAFRIPLVLISRFETLYVFCGSAALIGALVGSFAALVGCGFTSLFNLADASTVATPDGRSNKSRMRARRKLQQLPSMPEAPISPSRLCASPRSSFPPTVPTILEEEDEDASYAVRYRGRRYKNRGKIGEELDSLWPDDDENTTGDSSF